MPSNEEELARAIVRGDVAGVQHALTGGAQPDGVDEAGTPFLEQAVLSGHEEIVRTLLVAGVDPNLVTDLDEPILAEALRRQDEGMVRVLVEFGASLAALDDEYGSVLHHEIAGRDLPSFADVLLDLHVPVNQADRNGWTPLHLAAAYGYKGSVRLLLDHGADVTVRTLHGLTPADLAANNGHSRLAVVLSAPTPPDHAPG